MNNMIITFEDGSKKEYRKGTKFGDIVNDVAIGRDVICGNYNNIILNYDDPIAKSGKLIFSLFTKFDLILLITVLYPWYLNWE